MSYLLNPYGYAGGASVPSSNLVLWLKADAIVGLSDGDPVTTWADSSGNGNDATGSGTARPTYRSSSLNSKPSVFFDGVNDVLSLTSTVCTGACTVFVVSRAASATGSAIRPLLGRSTFSNSYELYFNTNSSGGPFQIVTDQSSNYRTTFWSQMNVTKAGSAVGQSIAFRVNSSSFGSLSGTSDTSSGIDRVGGTRGTGFWPGQISEIIIYNTVLSGGDITTVETYLETKYAASNTRQLHLAGDAITGKSDGDPLATWLDTSGKANHFVTKSGFTDATYKTNLLNSLPGVRFTAASTGMVANTTESSLCLSAFDYTIYAVYDYRSAISNSARAVQGFNNWLIGPYSNTHSCFSGGFSTGLAVTQNQFVIAWVVGTGTTNTFNAAGTTYTSGGSGKPGIIALSGAGAFNEILNGDLVEVIIDSVANTNGATDTTYLALKSKYGL